MVRAFPRVVSDASNLRADEPQIFISAADGGGVARGRRTHEQAAKT